MRGFYYHNISYLFSLINWKAPGYKLSRTATLNFQKLHLLNSSVDVDKGLRSCLIIVLLNIVFVLLTSSSLAVFQPSLCLHYMRQNYLADSRIAHFMAFHTTLD